MELRAGRPQFLLERPYVIGRLLAGLFERVLRRSWTVILKRQDDKIAVVVYRLGDQRQQMRPTIDPQCDIGVADRRIGGVDFEQQCSHGRTERFAQNVEQSKARRTGRRLEILSHRPARKPDNLVAEIDHHVRWIIFLHLAPRALFDPVAGPLRSNFGFRRSFVRRPARRQFGKVCPLGFAPVEDTIFFVEGSKEPCGARYRLRGSEEQFAAWSQGIVEGPHDTVLHGRIDVDQ